MTSDFREPVLLGRTGLRVSRLGIGASYGVPAAAIEKAFAEYGVNYFYWGSRRHPQMGRALKALIPQHRDRMVIAFQSYDHTGLLMRGAHERGLRALGIDCADVLILGWHNKRPSQRVLDGVAQLKQQGKVRFVALSGHNRPLFAELATSDTPIDIHMIRYNAAHRGAEREIFATLPEENRPGITCYTATRWGNLIDPKKMPAGEKPLSSADCYRFALSHPRVDLCMTGPKNAAEMDEALRALDAGPLNDAEMERVRRIGDHVHENTSWFRRLF